MITAKIIQDLAGLNNLDRLIPGRASNMARQMAEDARDIVKSSWSGRSPSAPGDPPAVVSGRLDRSIVAEGSSEGGGLMGILSGKGSKILWSVKATVEHGIYQEVGTNRMDPRPYLSPAVEIVSSRLGDYAKTVFEIRIS